ncbi:D-ribose-binding periplasmic protein precursor [Rhodobacteraceae bacterium THAF1]|uniref:sugar ABC transporter substrate-binding protein n=1 Tax=Palleronia sp. THAF1 TaxID=2587842 RepID=UPI000F3D93E2|nr:sugar ABC transporter substrate-binding protein [Palleronia sp. THAF1]QFU07557.1 D-ribose-binding periplasmic protein precursor [Palleronia sp. THAF1]VDC22890.1 D-ribose-binding periplasmic protein precursor [Rhodobacteraceae bacterium THAF1]
MTKFIKTATVLAGMTIAAPALAQDIIVVAHGQANDPFWSVVKNGADMAAEHTGANVDFRSPETFDMVQMSQLIDAAVNQEPDGLVVSIPDADALGPSIERAVQAGIPVISMNSGSDVAADLGALLHVGQDEFTAGRVAGEALAEMGGTTAICVNQEVGNVALDLRCEGFTEGFGGDVEVIPTQNDPAEVQAKVQAALESNPDVDTVMGLGASLVGEPAIAAVEAVGRTGEVMVATFDLSAGFLEAVAEGNAAFAIDQQQFLQGYLPVVFLAMNAEYGLVPGGDVPSGPNLVTQDKAAQVVDLSSQGIR